MPKATMLADLVIDESSGVDYPANLQDGWLVMKSGEKVKSAVIPVEGGSVLALLDKAGELVLKATKTEGGKAFPSGDYAFVPDPNSPSTWKLRLTSTPGGSPDARIVGAAIAALGPGGFRGQRVQIPKDALASVKRRVASAWKKANPDMDPEKMPAVLKSEGGESLTIKREELAEDVLKFVEDVEAKLKKAEEDGQAATDRVTELEAKVTDLEAKITPAPEGDPVDKSKLPEDVRKALEAAETERAEALKKNQEMEERIAKMERREREGEYIAKARTLANLGKAEDLGTLLLDVAEKVGDDTYKSLERILKAANAQLEADEMLTKVIGDPNHDGGNTPEGKIHAAAMEIVKAGGAPTVEQAKILVLKNRPDLRDELAKSRRG